MDFLQELGQALPRCSNEPFESAVKKRKANMPVGDASFCKAVTLALECVVKSHRTRVAFSNIDRRSLAGEFNLIGEQVRCRWCQFRKGKVYGPEKVVVAG
jgi:hypothetical protein